MAISWSAMRKKLEKDNLCASLQGRIQYFATRYRTIHDSEGGVAVRVDGKEVFRSDHFRWMECMFSDTSEERDEMTVDEVREEWQRLQMSANGNGNFERHQFYKAYYEYDNQSIEKSLESEDAIVRLFAILDKRVGKRTLEKLLPSVEQQPEWLRYFYRLRIEADNITQHE